MTNSCFHSAIRTCLAGSAGLLAIAAVSSSAIAADKKITIALVPGMTTDAFYITMHRGAEAAAKALGVDLIFQGAPEWSVVQQVPVLDAVISRNPDAIVIVPTDKQQLIAPLKKAVDAGIPVICVDVFIGNGVYQTGNGNADFPKSLVASDNVLGGRIAARALAKVIGDKGKVYVSNTVKGVSGTDQREEGFKLEMKDHPGIQVLETQFDDDDSNKAAAQAEAVLARTPDLAGVFGANGMSATGAANGIRQAGATGKVRVVGFDAPTSIVEQIKTGQVDITIAQHPAEIGYFGVMTAYAVATGQSVPTRIGTGFTVMDKSNIDDPDVKKYIYTN
jgi:ribose transport system substrate-binding protein